MGTSANAERRTTPRRAFGATVELAQPEDTEAYEADAVDLSIGGMALRTAYLPDVGSELECSFSLEGGQPVLARGQVMWAKGLGDGRAEGAFGLRFQGMSPEDMQVIHSSMPGDLANEPAPAPTANDNRARLHLPGMDVPLKAHIRGAVDGGLVLSSPLSFLKVGEAVGVERDGASLRGAIRGVAVEIDPRTQVAQLVLTIASANSAKREAPAAAEAAPSVALATPERSSSSGRTSALPVMEEPAPSGPVRAENTAAEARRRVSELGVEAPLAKGAMAEPRPSTPEPAPSTSGVKRTQKPHPTEVLSEAPLRASVPEAPKSATVATAARSEDGTADYDDEGEQDDVGDSRAPAWLVTMLGQLRTVASAAAPRMRAIVTALAAFIARAVAAVKAKLGRGEDIAEADTLEAPTARRPLLRKQLPDAPAAAATPSATDSMARTARRRYGLYALAGFGVIAIGIALFSGGREAPARTPRPRVAVAGSSASAEAPVATLTEPAANAPLAESAPGTPTGEPVVANGPVGGGAGAGAAAAMPTDLVAASRSRNADVTHDAPSLRAPSRPAPAAAAHPAPARPAVASTTRVLGNPAVRTGTLLRLRMDGPIASLLGGASAGNAITLRLAGRHSVDMAAPLVRQDARLVNASVYNRNTGAEVTLRFRDNVPAFSARAAGNTLEITLGAPTPAQRAGAHAPAPAAARAAHAR